MERVKAIYNSINNEKVLISGYLLGLLFAGPTYFKPLSHNIRHIIKHIIKQQQFTPKDLPKIFLILYSRIVTNKLKYIY